jgi:hypothetical protein
MGAQSLSPDEVAQAISGIYEEFTVAETHELSRSGQTATVVIDVSQSGIKRATWTWPEATYSLTATGSVPVSEIWPIVESVSKD